MSFDKSLASLCWASALAILMSRAGKAAEEPELFRSHEEPGSGSGYFMTEADFSPLSLHAGLEAVDIDGDGFIDLLVVANGAMPTGAYKGATSPDGTAHCLGPNQWLYGAASGPPGTGDPSPNMVSGSIKGDPDGIHYNGGDLGWFKNDGLGHFQLHFIEDISGGDPRPTRLYGAVHAEAADLDGDGDMDIVVWCGEGRRSDRPPDSWGASRVVWFENRLPSGFLQRDLVGDIIPSAGTVADLNGDGFPDILVANKKSGGPSLFWLKNQGFGTAFSLSSADLQSIRVNGVVLKDILVSAVAVSDLDSDGDMDIVIAKKSPPELWALFQNPDGTFQRQTVGSGFPMGPALAIGDVNNDGGPDIAVGAGPVYLYQSNGKGGRWSEVELVNADQRSNVIALRFADLNGDGREDLVAEFAAPLPRSVTPDPDQSALVGAWINPNSSDPWPFIPLPEETQRQPGGGAIGGGLAIADFDGDGDLDVVRAHRDFPLVFFENAWNTQRLFCLTANLKQNEISQKVTTFISTRPDRSPGRPVGQGTSVR